MTEPASQPRYKRGREQAGLSIVQAARLLGWDPRALAFHEECHDGLGLNEASLADMAKIYGCSVAWLRGDHVEPPAELVRMLRDSNVSDHDRDVILEFAASIQGRPPVGTAREALARASTRHESPGTDQPRATKVRYVKSQGQTRSHHCHWPGCDKQVPPAMWGCKAHWLRLPKALRDRVWATYRPGQERDMTPSREYLDIADEVQRWIREHGGAR